MDVELSQDESDAVSKALMSYLSDLRMEISDTDNPEYKRELRDERATLERAVTKLAGSSAASNDAEASAAGVGSGATLRVVRLWWTAAP